MFKTKSNILQYKYNLIKILRLKYLSKEDKINNHFNYHEIMIL